MFNDTHEIRFAGDVVDKASDAEELFRSMALEETMRASKAPKDFDGKTCYDCAEDIPEGRLSIGAYRCIPCQELVERNSKVYRR